ncbi:hypothetical protein BD779DRAFT_1472399 [Infundibulicybe gibba]|nr:hypothetical protein BD779DRAFT_1472399 [Infundibulicybe gibba]
MAALAKPDYNGSEEGAVASGCVMRLIDFIVYCWVWACKRRALCRGGGMSEGRLKRDQGAVSDGCHECKVHPPPETLCAGVYGTDSHVKMSIDIGIGIIPGAQGILPHDVGWTMLEPVMPSVVEVSNNRQETGLSRSGSMHGMVHMFGGRRRQYAEPVHVRPIPTFTDADSPSCLPSTTGCVCKPERQQPTWHRTRNLSQGCAALQEDVMALGGADTDTANGVAVSVNIGEPVRGDVNDPEVAEADGRWLLRPLRNRGA